MKFTYFDEWWGGYVEFTLHSLEPERAESPIMEEAPPVVRPPNTHEDLYKTTYFDEWWGGYVEFTLHSLEPERAESCETARFFSSTPTPAV